MSERVPYWCHRCRRILLDGELTNDFTCRICNTGFVEPDAQVERTPPPQRRQPPRNPAFTGPAPSGPDFMAQLFGAVNNAMQQQQGATSSSAPRAAPSGAPFGFSFPTAGQAPPPQQAPPQQPPPRTGGAHFGFPEFQLLNVVIRGVTRAWNPTSSNNTNASRSSASGTQSSPAAGDSSSNPQQSEPRQAESAPPQPDGAAPDPGNPNDPTDNPTAFLNNLLGGLFPPNATIRIEFNQFTPNGEAMFNGSLDDIINQLLNSSTTESVRISESDLAFIPKIKVSQERVENEAQCTTCMEMFGLEEEVCRLDCDHIFHEGCIVPWLRIHNTCPVCRGEVVSKKWRPTPMQTFKDDELD
uniref:RING-type domain-containing protein n=1 Tax=Panagrellus redivivus TaxID=6233 RepID=A0A7E4W852_PANRE